MKYFLTLAITCVFLQAACQSSSKQAGLNAQPANTQQVRTEQSPITGISTNTQSPSPSSAGNSGLKGSAEAHYITFSGIRDVQITDGQGNDNGPVSTAYRKNVPGVGEMVIGSESVQIITPTDNSYTMRFVGTGSPIAIEDIRGVNNEMSNAAYVVQYTDLVIQSGRVAELRIVGGQVESLKQDADGDGTPETIIQPGRSIADPKNADMQPPTINVKWGPPSPSRSVTITADDPSGVKKIYYRAGNDGNFQTTDSTSVTFTVDSSLSKSIQTAAEDNAGNRSDVRTYSMP